MYYYDEPARDYGHEQYDPNDEPVCVCPDYYGAQHPAFCTACNAWTDDVELAALEAEIPALPRIATPVYKMNLEEVA